jgi:hypothetical protein
MQQAFQSFQFSLIFIIVILFPERPRCKFVAGHIVKTATFTLVGERIFQSNNITTLTLTKSRLAIRRLKFNNPATKTLPAKTIPVILESIIRKLVDEHISKFVTIERKSRSGLLFKKQLVFN